jgi:hypothetical protein
MDSLKISAFPETELRAVFILIGVCDSLPGALSNLQSWITPSVTIGGTVGIVGLWILGEILLWHYGISWVVKNPQTGQGQKVRIKGIGLQPRLMPLAVVFCLWIPRAVDFLFPLEVPELTFSLMTFNHSLEPGKQFNGVEWRPNYYQYDLAIGNKSESSEILDLRIETVMPGGIIEPSIHSQVGVEEIFFERVGFDSIHLPKGKGGRVFDEVIKTHSII